MYCPWVKGRVALTGYMYFNWARITAALAGWVYCSWARSGMTLWLSVLYVGKEKDGPGRYVLFPGEGDDSPGQWFTVPTVREEKSGTDRQSVLYQDE
jgi:hypothetical protein